MKKNRKIYFWQEICSIHQVPLLEALACDRSEPEVILVCIKRLPTERRELGWTEPSPQRIRTMFIQHRSEAEELFRVDSANSVHIVSSPHRLWHSALAVERAAAKKQIIGLMAEWRDHRGLKGILRMLESLVAERKLAGCVDFVLGISSLALNWYAKTGFPKSKLFPFAYFPSLPATYEETSELTVQPATPFRLLYVGRLISLKSIELLIRACALQSSGTWQLRIVGTGPERLKLESLTDTLGISKSVFFVGALDREYIFEQMRDADLLVLPSAAEGWGAVVNEALSVGLPVVVSSYCGAKDLVDGVRGDVFRSGDLAELTKVLGRKIQCGKLPQSERRRIAQWGQVLQPTIGASYLHDVIDFVENGKTGASPNYVPRPTAPWLAA